MLTKKLFLTVSTVILLLLAAFNLLVIGSPLEEFFFKINGSIFEPILNWSLSIVVSAVVLMFFSREVFTLWFRNLFRWFLPIGLLLTFISDPSSSFTFPDKAGVAMILGEILVVVTIILALVQKFYNKH